MTRLLFLFRRHATLARQVEDLYRENTRLTRRLDGALDINRKLHDKLALAERRACHCGEVLR